MNIFRNFLTGFLIGIANLIPGVSGGTFALILGVYERLITFLNSINLRRILHLLQLLRQWLTSGFKHGKRQELIAYLKENDYPFMAVIGLGAIICIVTMSSVMKYLLLNHFTYTYAYFFGLIILSVIIPWRMIKTLRPFLALPLLGGILLTVLVTAGVNPYDKALNKSTMLEQQYLDQQNQAVKPGSTGQTDKTVPLSYIGKYTSGEYLNIFFCGIIAISAMVLPGVSGSLVLILMNQYFAVISALANIRALLIDDLLFLAAMSLGIGIGLLSFARFIEFAFRRFHDSMVCFLVGLIGGSLYALWPFKGIEVIGKYYVKEGSAVQLIEDYTVYTNANILPHDLTVTMIAVLFVALGMGTMQFFLRWEKNS
jgi:putative membrane protein